MSDEPVDLLFTAAADNKVADVEKILDSGVDIDSRDEQGRTALIVAAFHESGTTMELLVKRGADVNAVDSEGQTALMNAALNGYYQAITLLCRNGADFNYNANNDFYAGSTALMQAAWGRNCRAIRRMLQYKLEINAIDDLGRTALSCAVDPERESPIFDLAMGSCLDEHLDVVKELLNAGADPNIGDAYDSVLYFLDRSSEDLPKGIPEDVLGLLDTARDTHGKGPFPTGL